MLGIKRFWQGFWWFERRNSEGKLNRQWSRERKWRGGENWGLNWENATVPDGFSFILMPKVRFWSRKWRKRRIKVKEKVINEQMKPRREDLRPRKAHFIVPTTPQLPHYSDPRIEKFKFLIFKISQNKIIHEWIIKSL